MKKTLIGPQLVEAFELHKDGASYAELGARYGVDPTTIMNRLRTVKGFVPRLFRRRRKHIILTDYFAAIDTPEKAYFLGLLMADGYNLEGSMVALDLIDEELVVAFRDVVCPSRTLKILKRTRHRGAPIYACRIKSKEFSECLARAGVRQRKSFTARYPKSVPDHLHNHFVRGLFDGDGTIVLTEDKNTGRYLKGYVRVVGTKAILSRIRSLLRTELSVRSSIRPMKSIFELGVYGNRQVIRVRDWLYTDAATFLKRKRDRLNSL